MRISQDRVLATFIELIQIDGESFKERPVCDYLKSYFQPYAEIIVEDNAGEKIGANCGNLFIRVKGTDTSAPAVVLSAHMDTIKSTAGIKPIVGNGLVRSDGTTILGADNRLGIALICEAVRSLVENHESYGDIEILFSICEEVGLLGVKNFDFSMLKGKYAYVLDSGNNPVYTLINKAPSAIRFEYEVMGKSAHSGIAPEKGINAIAAAASAVSRIDQGRVNENTTVNIGVIQGGKACNIIPDNVFLKGETRSYRSEDISIQWERIRSVFSEEATKLGATVKSTFNEDYHSFYIEESSPIITHAQNTADNTFTIQSSFGGSDGNVFNRHGIEAVVLGTGQWEPHTNEEYVRIDEMARSSQWIYDIVKSFSVYLPDGIRA
ncbi:MAG: M20/M25/M40 family metallo-hydrolase [Candidatus Auribacterota bacterium]|nr:M20/M25/M40 family metallo-hydrolase [Candidatus Auribacterota bacterium]